MPMDASTMIDWKWVSQQEMPLQSVNMKSMAFVRSLVDCTGLWTQ
jgi:hypothetical protein